MRQSDDDYCKPTIIAGRTEHFCKNDGICYSTNEGPKCDCSLSDYDGRRCEQGWEAFRSFKFHKLAIIAYQKKKMKKFPVKIDAELSFFGQEWLGYDVGNNSAAVIRSRFENISFAFKTVHGRQVLFVGGDRMVRFVFSMNCETTS
uniref:EGF-like domain-containing protein n=1 Tax=Parascaris equorum TaxID=6256 RepID=A0A914S297_PAREQ